VGPNHHKNNALKKNDSLVFLSSGDLWLMLFFNKTIMAKSIENAKKKMFFEVLGGFEEFAASVGRLDRRIS